MKTFKQYLDEAAKWTEGSFFNIFIKEQQENEGDVFIPLSSALIKRTVGSVEMYAAHVLGYENVDRLMSIQNKKSKAISAFTSETDSVGGISTSGIWGGSGVVAIIKGNALAGGEQDIMSLVDKKGTRYVNISPEGGTIALLAKRRVKNAAGDFDKFKRDLNTLADKIYELKEKIFRNELKTNPALKTYVEGEGVVRSYLDGLFWIDEYDAKAKYRMIKAFYDGFEPIVMKYKEAMHFILAQYAQQMSLGNKSSTPSAYDEIIMSNFKVVKFLVITDKELPGGLDGKLVAERLKEKFRLPVVETTFNGIKFDISTELAKLGKQ